MFLIVCVLVGSIVEVYTMVLPTENTNTHQLVQATSTSFSLEKNLQKYEDSLNNQLVSSRELIWPEAKLEMTDGELAELLSLGMVNEVNCRKHEIPCPSQSARSSTGVCVTSDQICNGMIDCPNGEDEIPTQCFFYEATKNELRSIQRVVLDNLKKDENSSAQKKAE